MKTPAYDDTNIFAKILRGEIPSHKIYEDADTFAFMDIMPRGDGQRLHQHVAGLVRIEDRIDP